MDARDVPEVHRRDEICGEDRCCKQRQAPPTLDARPPRSSQDRDPEANEREGKQLVDPPGNDVREATEIVQLLERGLPGWSSGSRDRGGIDRARRWRSHREGDE